MRNDRFQSRERGNVAYYHLPGLFEFYELYQTFFAAVSYTQGVFL